MSCQGAESASCQLDDHWCGRDGGLSAAFDLSLSKSSFFGSECSCLPSQAVVSTKKLLFLSLHLSCEVRNPTVSTNLASYTHHVHRGGLTCEKDAEQRSTARG